MLLSCIFCRLREREREWWYFSFILNQVRELQKTWYVSPKMGTGGGRFMHWYLSDTWKSLRWEIVFEWSLAGVLYHLANKGLPSQWSSNQVAPGEGFQRTQNSATGQVESISLGHLTRTSCTKLKLHLSQSGKIVSFIPISSSVLLPWKGGRHSEGQSEEKGQESHITLPTFRLPSSGQAQAELWYSFF